MQKNNRTFKLTAVSFFVISYMGYAIADTETALDDEILELDTIHVQEYHANPKKYDVTGLGAIKKTKESLQRDQVENIRDLTRYDPDVGVNEAGGRGTSRGFSMRGVERERVAIDVDGFGSAPILKKDSPTSGYHRVQQTSSSINEIEYENLKEVDLRKGSASAESGNGALGGAVSMTTKDTQDFFSDDERQVAGRFKIGHTTKDRRTLYSGALAGRHNGFEGFVQYTKRQGHEVRAHDDLYNDGYIISHYAVDDNLTTQRTVDTYFDAEDVSGPQRRIPNPLDYHSESFLSKFGYHFSNQHYLGAVVENTIQKYDLREMFLPNYYAGSNANVQSYEPLFPSIGTISQYQFTPTRFYFDKHKNKRVGLEYKYHNEQQDFIIDQAILRLDRRDLKLQSTALTLSCSYWPSVDKNCFPNDANYIRGQLGDKHFSELKEKDIKFDVNLVKNIEIVGSQHQLQLKTGVIKSDYEVTNYWLRQKNTERTVEENRRYSENYYLDGPHSTGKMKGQNIFISLSDRIHFNDKFNTSLALRYDRQTFRANPTEESRKYGLTFEKAKYGEFSWDIGLAYRPIEPIEFTYRASTGFRTPSIIELIGPGFNNERFNPQQDTQGSLKAEKSFNQEVGIELIGSFMKVSASYFITEYRDVIGRAVKYHDDRSLPGYATSDIYFNLYNFTTHGFDIKSYVDANSLWSKLPAGLEFRANVGVTKIKKQKPISDDFGIVSSYSFDAIQPLKLVYGVEYHAPSEKWGMSLMNTYSKAKNLDELISTSRQNTLTSQGARVANIKTKSWLTTDLTGYYHFSPYITLRGGVYNVFNYRYVTWEAARQTAFGSEARQTTENYSALAAPGRNFLLNLEMKF
ncbi:TonB-dependent hemoglobin/transferrin/lactoferrin family receptor [Volucribacter amazonae]|uniref:Hemoglobin/transferrin/lactoferrin receptor protein n=1 Tax=Volucribacter amazonae TaxID=256731 RepID=A0A9X4P827_9PAST|nr:TonB-dependent hemoglobin/transferrin/lactoferrin family receptor [Volucribacter amazonae]MDG6894365.1 hypothetical protein [Volucribacter amazonae]